VTVVATVATLTIANISFNLSGGLMAKSVARLFEQFQPSNYGLALYPNRKTMTFSGSVTVAGKKTGRPSQRLTFHQKDLKITAASIIKHDKKGLRDIPITRINTQESLNEVRLHTEELLYPGEYVVSMEFEGVISKPMNGIYPCFFKHDGQDKVLVATQFESHHAREAFPCIDEPEAKATFDLTLMTPVGETVIANTPIKVQQTKEALLVTSFETTPRMSTYLLAFAYGEFEYLEAITKGGVKVRTYATPDNVNLTAHSLSVATRVLDFFSDYFGIPYPLPKLDMIALPDFSAGAMENWGMVTYREIAMLYNDAQGSIENKQYVATVVAHELSHQWFGNLVTMKWWNDLWLNESFATMMEYRGVDALYPEWQIWEQFVSTEIASAKRRDSLVDVQAIQTEVHHPDEISSLFDPSIVYAKGGSVLYMLMNYLGEDVFRDGLKHYFEKHKYTNTVADDLWEALGAASKKDVKSFMHDWLTRPGYPLVSVDWQPGSETIGLTQERFLSDPTSDGGATKPWQLPLASSHDLSDALLSSLQQTTTVLELNDQPILFNHDGHSYYIARYLNKQHRKLLIDSLQASHVSPIDRLLLLDNYIMLQRGGQSNITDLLDLLSAYADEDNETVWGAIAMTIAEARRLIEGDEAAEAKLNAMVEHLVVPAVKKLSWDDAKDDTAQVLRMRGLVYSLAAGAKVQTVLDEGLVYFHHFKKGSDLSASTRTVIYFIGARYGDKTDFERLVTMYRESQNAEEKDDVAGALTSVKVPERYQALLAELDSDMIRRQDVMHWFVWLLRNRFARADAWQWMVSHWEWILQEFSSDKSFGYYARYAGSIFSRKTELDQFLDFFNDKRDIIAMTREIKLGEQEIRSRIAWRERNETAAKAWLSKV
jgi:aminopeptidase N